MELKYEELEKHIKYYCGGAYTDYTGYIRIDEHHVRYGKERRFFNSKYKVYGRLIFEYVSELCLPIEYKKCTFCEKEVIVPSLSEIRSRSENKKYEIIFDSLFCIISKYSFYTQENETKELCKNCRIIYFIEKIKNEIANKHSWIIYKHYKKIYENIKILSKEGGDKRKSTPADLFNDFHVIWHLYGISSLSYIYYIYYNYLLKRSLKDEKFREFIRDKKNLIKFI